MGKRINPILFRLGVTRKWKNSCFKSNYTLHLSKQLQIQQYLTNLCIDFKSFTDQTIVLCTTPKGRVPTKNIERQLTLLTGIKGITLQFEPPTLFKHIFDLISRSQTLPSLLKGFPHPRILGIKIQIKGRIKGIAKAKTITYIRGKLPLQKLEAKIDYWSQSLPTPHGNLGTKLWVYYKPFR